MGINPGPGAVRDATSAAPAVLMKRLRGEGHLTYRDISLYTAICATVSAVFQIDMDSLFAPTRCKADKAFARQVAVYLAHIVGSKSYTEIGIVFGRDRTTAAHACRLVEDRRDDPVFDRLVDQIETAVTLLVQTMPAWATEPRIDA